MTEILPNSIAQRSSRIVLCRGGQRWIPIFCANCGKEGGLVLETDWERVKNWAFYLCDPCAEEWSPLVDTAIAPDEAFWNALHQEQLESFGRELAPQEIAEMIRLGNNALALLARDRLAFRGD